MFLLVKLLLAKVAAQLAGSSESYMTNPCATHTFGKALAGILMEPPMDAK
jgi:hypothetical protein